MTARFTSLYALFIFVTCVSAEGWDDFANNLATDLAPLITLFGEQITRQCLSESISLLDDFIFALAPLGVLTAVVSAIRVRGNSTLRAFIGRAQEDPGTAERELLSCVSNSTAEIFSNSGVARITGNPKILEVLVNDNPETDENVSIQKVSEGVGKDWPSGLDDDIQLPNLSLNKGIRRRAPFWFHLSATFGIGLQGGVIIFAGITVFRWPKVFQKNGHAVDGYAFPMFVVGTLVLTLGMFFCARTVEDSSKKHTIPLPVDSRVYWVQPGNQMVGDQVFPPFVGHTKKGARFVRSVKHHSPTEILNHGKELSLLSIVMLAMVGFVMQFIGLRGLHSSITLAQLGSTMVMTLVRTSLRAQRMHEGDNKLEKDEALVLSGGHELDWFTFSLMNIQSFRVCPMTSPEEQRPGELSQLAQECVEKRRILRDLTNANWNETPIRKMATKLAQATHDLMDLMHLWTDGKVSMIDVNIPIEVLRENISGAIRNDWKITLSVGDKRNSHAKSWEAILGLYIWSIKRANRDIYKEPQDLFFRIFHIKDNNAHQTRLLLQKWSYNTQMIDGNQEPVNALKECQTFGHSKIQSSLQPGNCGVPVSVSCGLDMLAAQDIYTYILFSVLAHLTNIGGKTCISGNDKHNFRVQNDRVDRLATSFQTAGLGDFSEGLLCILPALCNRNLLPEISIYSLEVRQQMEIFVQEQNHYGFFSMSEWLCCLDDYGNVERSLIEYGFLCLSGLMSPDYEMRRLAIERIVAIMNSTYDGNSLMLGSTYMNHIASTPHPEWWERFQSEIHCMATCISQHQAKDNLDNRMMQSLGEIKRQLGAVSANNRTYHNLVAAAEWHSAFLDLWFGMDGWVTSNDTFAYPEVLDWLIQHNYTNILEWLVMQVMDENSEGEMAEMMACAASKQHTNLIQILSRHSEKGNVRDEIVSLLASEGDVQTLEMLFDTWNDDTLMKSREIALLSAAKKIQQSVIATNLQKGVDVDACGEDGETALLKVAAQGDISSVTLLLANGAALEKRDSNHDTALIVAATSGHVRVVELLVEKGADINTIGNRGRTALIAAVRIRNLSTLQYLLSRKADIHVRDHDQLTALDQATYADPWLEGCALLESAGVTEARNVYGESLE